MPPVHTNVPQIQILYASGAQHRVMLQYELRITAVARHEFAQTEAFRRQLLVGRRKVSLHSVKKSLRTLEDSLLERLSPPLPESDRALADTPRACVGK